MILLYTSIFRRVLPYLNDESIKPLWIGLRRMKDKGDAENVLLLLYT